MDDYLIIGGGVIGLSIAYDLAAHGVRVRVLDRGQPGQEASWAGAGILPPANPATAVDPLEQLRGISLQMHTDWAVRLLDETGIDNGYRRCGGIYLACSAGEAASLVGLAQMLDSLQIAVERLSAHDVVQLEPALRALVDSGRLRGAWLLPDEAQLRNPRHVRALMTACEKRGVIVESGVRVQALMMQSGKVTGIQTSRGEISAEKFCLCAGAWTYDLLRKLDIQTGILPVRGQMVLFRAAAPLFTRVLNEGPRYLVPRDDGHVLAGSTEEEVGFDKHTTNEAIHELTSFAREMVDGLRHAEIERTWAGLRPGSFDGFPYLGAIPGLQNAFVAAGHFRSGLLLSTGTALVMGQLMRGEPTSVDLTPFRVGRG